jgi:hypothetical protein
LRSNLTEVGRKLPSYDRSMKKIVASYFACLAAFFVSRQDETEITKGFGPPRNIPKLSFA